MSSRHQCIYPSSICTSQTHLLGDLSPHEFQFDFNLSSHDNDTPFNSGVSEENITEGIMLMIPLSRTCVGNGEKGRLKKVSRGFARLQKALSAQSDAATVKEWQAGNAGGGGMRNDSVATTIVVSDQSTVSRTSSVYSGATMGGEWSGEVNNEKEGEKGGVVGRMKRVWRVGQGKYEMIEECEDERGAKKQVKREKKERERREREQWLLEQQELRAQDMYFGGAGVVDWRLVMGLMVL